MQPNSKYTKYWKDLDEINLQDEDGYIATTKVKFAKELKKQEKHDSSTKNDDKNNVWFTTIEKYLNSVEYAFDKGNSTSKKVSHALDNIPEPTSKKFFLRFTIFLAFLVLIIFFTSCKANAQSFETNSGINNNQVEESPKGQEQMFIKRENLIIKSREPGSPSGSIWADSPQPKSLVTEYQPSRTGEVVTVTIPDDLQYKPTGQSTADTQKYDPVKSFKFEIVGFEPGGDVYLRGIKNYISDSGEQRNILVMAKMPQRNLNKFEVDAKELTQVTISDSKNGAISDYSSAGWDLVASRKISGYAPDLNSAIASLDGQKKDLDTQQKALKEQQKALADESERIKKDRNRLNAETAQAKQIIDASTIMDPAPEGGSSGNGNNKQQGNNKTGSGTGNNQSNNKNSASAKK